MKKRTKENSLKDKNKNTKETEKLTVEELEARVAMSVPTQKKFASIAPYAPGTDYGLVKRANLKEEKKETEKLTVEELEERVAMSVPTQKKGTTPAPYAPGTLYGLVKRANL